MIERGDGARLAFEALGEAQHRYLDGHVALQSPVARAIHLTHAAAADRLDDLVGSERVASCQRHTADKPTRRLLQLYAGLPPPPALSPPGFVPRRHPSSPTTT